MALHASPRTCVAFSNFRLSFHWCHLYLNERSFVSHLNPALTLQWRSCAACSPAAAVHTSEHQKWPKGFVELDKRSGGMFVCQIKAAWLFSVWKSSRLITHMDVFWKGCDFSQAQAHDLFTQAVVNLYLFREGSPQKQAPPLACFIFLQWPLSRPLQHQTFTEQHKDSSCTLPGRDYLIKSYADMNANIVSWKQSFPRGRCSWSLFAAAYLTLTYSSLTLFWESKYRTFSVPVSGL